ncbi:MAG TPA: cytochrome c [Terracidiphilus sp.]|nr:cytochrome c [Terracidiphilus sp.]
MLKSLPLLSVAMLFAIAPASVSGRVAQEAAPAQDAAAAAQTPAPAAQEAAPAAQTSAPAAQPAASVTQTIAPVKGPMALDAKNPITPTAASLADAKKVFSRDCAMCHGDNGNGKTDLTGYPPMPDWTDPKTLVSKRDGELFNMIRVGDGKNPGMPGEDAGRAKDAEVWNMIHYIRSLSKAQTAAAPAPASAPAAPVSQQ